MARFYRGQAAARIRRAVQLRADLLGNSAIGKYELSSGRVLVVPERVIGRSTMESIQSGAVHGFAGMIDAIVAKIRGELGAKAKVIGTGGIVDWIASQTDTIDVIDPFLTLEGLRIIYEKNHPEKLK